MSDVADRVRKIVVEHLGVEEDKVVENASFIDDLGADSLDTVELVMAFEEEFGIEIPGWIKWSPAQFMYKQWAGLYQQGEQFLYVNRGLGFLGYPGRVGILPEVTVIELQSA